MRWAGGGETIVEEREERRERERDIYIYIIYNYISLLLSLFYMFIRVYICIEKMCGYIYEFRSREIDREIDRYIYIYVRQTEVLGPATSATKYQQWIGYFIARRSAKICSGLRFATRVPKSFFHCSIRCGNKSLISISIFHIEILV